jgi:uncharacterized flavoprotein (TIGR03862 family)
MAAEIAASGGAQVTVYEAMPSVGRKFLLAGRGGLNLTHGEELERFLTRYGEAAPRLRPAIEAFPPAAVRAWSEKLGQETFVGSSGRVFPKLLKTSPLLRAWLQRLDGLGVRFAFRHRWTSCNAAGNAIMTTPSGETAVQADAVVLALGGASWPKLGSDGGWVDILAKSGIAVAPLRPANCGFVVNWSDLFRDKFEGQPLKRIALTIGDVTVRGEAVVTRRGIEGGAVYALSAPLRETIAAKEEALLTVALRPDMSAEELRQKLQAPRGKQSFSNVLRKTLKLPPVAIGLLQEAAVASGHKLSAMTSPIASAISTAGGIVFDEVDENFMLRRRPGVFVAGEMLDWEAPTGGYLLQACFSTGVAAGKGALAYLKP